MRGKRELIKVDPKPLMDGSLRFYIGARECWIDAEDAIRIVGCSLSVGSNGYVKLGTDGAYLHRFLMGLSRGDGQQVDHISGNKCDNRKRNLRVCDQSHNMMNAPLRRNNKTKVTGVHWDKQRLRWSAQIAANNQTIPLGRFDAFEDAVAARRAAEDKYHGAHAARHGVLRGN